MKKIVRKELTDKVRQNDIVVLAVHLLGGDKKAVDTEDIAVKCHELSPGTFSWKKYPNQINLELVRVVLSNTKKHDAGELLSGSGREGWRLSPLGIEWISSHGKYLLRKGVFTVNTNRKNAGSIDTVRKKREKVRLIATPAWTSWNNGELISLRDAKSVFRIDEYATGKMRDIKIVRLRTLFEDDEKLGPFIREAEKIATQGT